MSFKAGFKLANLFGKNDCNHNSYRMYGEISMLALATLGNATQIGSFSYLSHHPRWSRKRQYCLSSVAGTDSFKKNFANVNEL
jgi:hypothetical protein